MGIEIYYIQTKTAAPVPHGMWNCGDHFTKLLIWGLGLIDLWKVSLVNERVFVLAKVLAK